MLYRDSTSSWRWLIKLDKSLRQCGYFRGGAWSLFAMFCDLKCHKSSMNIERWGLYPFSPARAYSVIIPKSPVAQSSLKDLPCSASWRLGGESNALLFLSFRHAKKSVQLLRCLCLRFFFYPLNYSWNQMPCFRNKQKPTQFPTNRLWNRISLLAFIADFWSLWVALCQPYLLYCLKQNQIGAAMRKLLLH